MDLPDLLAELKRRRVPRAMLWYVGACVAVVEAANVFLPSFGAPPGAVRFLAIVAVFGLPIAFTLAWMFDVSSDAATTRDKSYWTKLGLLGVVAAASITGAIMVWARDRPANAARAETQTFASDPSHIAVLGFTPVGAHDDELAAFASSLQMRLIDALGSASSDAARSSRRLRVVSRASVLPFSDGRTPLDSVRRALKVGTVVEGTVEQPTGSSRLIVRVRLVDAETGDQLASSVTERPASDHLALSEAVVDTVTNLIRRKLGPIVRERSRRLETRSNDAFNRVMWASQKADEFDEAYRHRNFDGAEAAIQAADSLFAEAERLDPKWIEPIVQRASLASKRVRLATARGSGDAEQWVDAGLMHAERALEKHPADYRAFEVRGVLRHLRWRIAPSDSVKALLTGAERDLRSALIGNPTPARALRVLSEVAITNKRLHEAVEYAQRAYSEDPYLQEAPFTLFRLTESLLALGRDAEAAKWCAEGRARFDEAMFYDCRLSLAAWTSDYRLTPDSAWIVVARELEKYPEPLRPRLEPRLHAMVAAVLARNQMSDSAFTLLRSARARDRSPGVLKAAAGAYTLLGAHDSAQVVMKLLLNLPPEKRGNIDGAPELRNVRR